MENKFYTITIRGESKKIPAGTTFEEVVSSFQTEEETIILAQMGNKLYELPKEVPGDGEVTLITTASKIGSQTYKRSVTLLLLKAIYDVYGREKIDEVKVLFSVGEGYYCTVNGDVKVDENFLAAVKARMQELVREDLPIKKQTINTDEAIERFHRYGMYDKERLFHYRRVSKVNIYSIGNFEDYYYGYMANRTGVLKYFDLFLYEDGFVLELPSKKHPHQTAKATVEKKLFSIQLESTSWGDMLGTDNVGALNDCVAQGGAAELILVQEALMEKKIAQIAEEIKIRPSKKLVMIAGPSSSGKTTFSHRLSIQLRAHGLKPHPIAVDDYFVDREYTPRDEKGDYNFECLEAIDTEQFNKDMNDLLAGKTVELPSYNFKTGKREYKGNYKTLGKDDILVIEGIHCLNDKLSHTLPRENKFKIYISALTQLNIDEHNRISTTDGRLIRRLVRDARTRGVDAKSTIARWPSVRRGEEENIFPYQEEADVMINSALIYELAVLKQYAEPLLFGIGKDEPEYIEAKRLLKFLDYFVPISSDNIPINSIIREFVGGGCFNL
jgi:uridine kinase